jgi:hypothetical protein
LDNLLRLIRGRSAAGAGFKRVLDGQTEIPADLANIFAQNGAVNSRCELGVWAVCVEKRGEYRVATGESFARQETMTEALDLGGDNAVVGFVVVGGEVDDLRDGGCDRIRNAGRKVVSMNFRHVPGERRYDRREVL